MKPGTFILLVLIFTAVLATCGTAHDPAKEKTLKDLEQRVRELESKP